MDNTANLAALRAAVPLLTASDKDFAESLLKQSERRALSEKQLHWVLKLVKRVTEPTPGPVEIADVSGVIALFERAATHLKFPKLVMRVGHHDLRLSLAGNKSKAPGTVAIAGAIGGWYGRITRNGIYEPGRDVDADTVRQLTEALKAFAANPAKFAADYGKLTGICCFCSTPLSDDRSTRVGYGPTCAQTYGLPWGSGHSAEHHRHNHEMPTAAD